MDYDRTLFCLREFDYGQLLYIMYETEDDLLSERIRQFIDALQNNYQDRTAREKQQNLLNYLEHASTCMPIEDEQVSASELGTFFDF